MFFSSAQRKNIYIIYLSFVVDFFIIWRVCGVIVCSICGNCSVSDAHVSVFVPVCANARICRWPADRPSLVVYVSFSACVL